MVSGKPVVVQDKFYTIATDSFEEQFGFLKGQVVLTVGEGFFPISEEDPYLFRRFFAVARFEDGTLNFDEKPIVVKPESLEEISEELQESLQGLLKAFEEVNNNGLAI